MDANLPDCPNIHVPRDILAAVVRIESASNPFAIGVVGGRLVRQPKNINEAVATVRDLESRGYNYSVGMSQVNRTNFQKYGINQAELAFDVCANLEAGSKILQECFSRSKNDWGKAFSCYYSGNFVTGYKHGYVQKVTQAFLASADKKSAAVSLVAPVIKPTENKLEGSVANISDMPATVANTDTNKRISKTTTQVVNKTYNKLETQGQPSEFTDVAQVF